MWRSPRDTVAVQGAVPGEDATHPAPAAPGGCMSPQLPIPDPPADPRVVIKDQPVGPPCSICALPRVVVIEHDLLLCLRCDDFPQRKAVIAALRAELNRSTP